MEITDQERQKIITAYFNEDQTKLNQFPSKLKRKIVILDRLIQCFEKNRTYSEKEINAILKPFYDDFVLIRRLLIERHYMERTNDGREYWVK